MIDGSEKHNGWLNLEFQSLHVIEKHRSMFCLENQCTVTFLQLQNRSKKLSCVLLVYSPLIDWCW